MTNQTILTECKVCGSGFSDSSKIIPYPTRSSISGVPQNIRVCGVCGFGIAEPMPDQKFLDALYENSIYWGNSKKISPKRQPIFWSLAQARWKVILPHLDVMKVDGSLKLLDVGAGYGYLGIVGAQETELLFDYTALEPDPNLRSRIAECWSSLGGRNQLHCIADWEEAIGKYDIIVLSHVLEHVNAPLGFLEKVSSYLTERGLLFIDVPNMDYLFKDDVFPHMLFFTQQSLEQLVQKINLEVVSSETLGVSRNRSPLNPSLPFFLRMSFKLMTRLTNLLPFKLSLVILSRIFGTGTINADGTWLRILAKNRIRRK